NKTSVLSGTAKAPIARVEAELRKTVANPEVLERYGTASVPSAPSLSPPPAAAVAYAIITTQAIYSSCKSEIDAYATHLVNHDGYDPSNVRIVTEGASEGYNTWADATEAQERALNIRQWLINYASEDWNVLLIGDPSPKTGDVPICL
ncbi:MAG: hypothetical protein GX267_00695, partial [Fibrobacter sp.]|nr:hypothetical protein [Fibrobacter sp.]